MTALECETFLAWTWPPPGRLSDFWPGLGIFFLSMSLILPLTSLGLSLAPCLHPGLGALGGRHHAELSVGFWAQELGLTGVDKNLSPESVPGPLGVIHFHNPLSSPTEALEHYFPLKVKGRMCQAGWILLPDPKGWTRPSSHLCDSRWRLDCGPGPSFVWTCRPSLPQQWAGGAGSQDAGGFPAGDGDQGPDSLEFSGFHTSASRPLLSSRERQSHTFTEMHRLDPYMCNIFQEPGTQLPRAKHTHMATEKPNGVMSGAWQACMGRGLWAKSPPRWRIPHEL